MNSRQIEKVIGKPEKVNWKKPKAIGSASFFLKSFKTKNNSKEKIKKNSKCNFEKYSDGILLRSNLSNKLGVLPIKETEIELIKLIRGKEKVEPLTLSPMWFLLKIGVSKLIARYFRVVIGEYSIEEMKLKIETKNEIMEFTQNGYIFERQLEFFKSLNYGEKLKIELNE